ncbi:MAG: hypothetical protein AAF447_08420 [Myxococcota bacterium]
MQRFLPHAGTVTFVAGLVFWLGALVPELFLEPLYTVWFMGDATPMGPKALFGTGLFGAITAGFGLTIRRLGLGVVANEIDAPLLRRALLEGLVLWFVTDNTASVATGAYPNVALNVAFLAMLLIPVLALPAGRDARGALSTRAA